MMWKQPAVWVGVAVLAFFAVVIPADAQSNHPPSGPQPLVQLTTDGNWQGFSFGAPGSTTGPLEFTGAGILDITDAFLSGDRFEIFDNGVSLGLTEVPTTSGDFESDYDIACADPRWSAGSFDLGPGNHSIDIVAVDSPFGGGGLGVRFPGTGCAPLGVVPTMGQNALFALAAVLAFAGYFLLRRRRLA